MIRKHMKMLNLILMRTDSIRLTTLVLKTQMKNIIDVSAHLNKKFKNTYGIENMNGMTLIHDNKLNNISECNLLHYIPNPPKCTKILNSNYSPILHGFMNNRKGKVRFKSFRILLHIGCISVIIIGGIVLKLYPKI